MPGKRAPGASAPGGKPRPSRARTPSPGPLIGAHLSISGGIDQAIERAREVGGMRTLQIFVKSSNQWRAVPFREGEVERFRAGRKELGLDPVLAHDSYLINLASPDDTLRERSRKAFLEELVRADALGVDYLVTHPGAHMGDGLEKGVGRIADSLLWTHAEAPGLRTRVLLENVAGQGTTVGRSFEELRAILDLLPGLDAGVCLDTCHLQAAGHDIGTPESYRATFASFDRVVGLSRLRAFHVNDAKKELGSRLDRHEHIGKGTLGLGPFRLLMMDPRFVNVPKILETPKEKDPVRLDRMNLKALRDLATTGRP